MNNFNVEIIFGRNKWFSWGFDDSYQQFFESRSGLEHKELFCECQKQLAETLIGKRKATKNKASKKVRTITN